MALNKPGKIGGEEKVTVIKGDGGKNNLQGGFGDQMIYGLGGNDTLNGGAGDDFLDGGKGNDSLDGGNGYDFLLGGSGNDRLDGGGKDDFLEGGAGNDLIKGGGGSDFIFSELGHDTLQGGEGKDYYYFEIGNTGGSDIINDFTDKTTDIVDLDDRTLEAVEVEAVDTNGNELADALRIFLSESDSVTIYNYFADTSELQAGDGKVTIILNDEIFTANDIIALFDEQ